jgi:predicted peroxiredoxin
VLTHSYDAIERAAAALQLATNMLAFDGKIDFFQLGEDVHMARKGMHLPIILPYYLENIFDLGHGYDTIEQLL